MLELYDYPSNASLAPHFLLAEMHSDYALKLNPAGRIPTLVHNELALFESPAICICICELDAMRSHDAQ